MKQYKWPDIGNCIRTIGRTFYEEKRGVLYMNWTCTGIEFIFKGTCLIADLCAFNGEEDEVVWVPDLGGGTESTPGVVKRHQEKRKTWPVTAVFLDDKEVPESTFTLDEQTGRQLLFFSEKEEQHKIRLVKLTENLKSFLGIKGFFAEGSLLWEDKAGDKEQKKKRCIEFVGDSITCGFGNMTNERDRLFYSEDENGWLSHASVAGRMLNMDFRLICSSGICAQRREALPHPYSMEELYEYTDRPLQEMVLHEEQLQKWDFAAEPADFVVINLGTNDTAGIFLSDKPEEEEKSFKSGYRRLIEKIRSVNGPETEIICALGNLNYYTYPVIEKIVEEYRSAAGDSHIRCFIYPFRSFAEPEGACGHPHWVSQVKMAEALVKWIGKTYNVSGC